MNYLVYKISGGINHMLVQINFAIHVSKNTNRFLIIDCTGNAFDNDFNKYFTIPNFNYSTNYEPIYSDNSIKIDEYQQYIKGLALSVGDVYYLNDKLITMTAGDIYHSIERILFCSTFGGVGMWGNIPWYIKVKSDVINKISINKITGKYIGVHYRNTDMKHDLESFVSEIYKYYPECDTIYLGTDDYTAFDRLSVLLEYKFNIIQYNKPYNNNGYSIHYGNPNKDEVIMTSLIDMYHLMHSTYFIPSRKSGFSKKIMQLRKKDDFFDYKKDWTDEVQFKSKRIYSQSNQDGVIEYIFENIGVTNKFCVEFGFNSNSLTGGSGSNVARLVLEDKWSCLLLDSDYENVSINLYKEFLTPENICSIFKKYLVPNEPDYVSIDVDSVDLWLMKSILKEGYRPRIISVEYNANFPLKYSYTVNCVPDYNYIGDMVYGASLLALNNVAEEFNYSLIGVVNSLDLFFIRNDLLNVKAPSIFKFNDLTEIPCHLKTTKERLKYLVEYPSMNQIPDDIIENLPLIFRI